METNISKYDYSKKLQNDYIILEELYGIRKLDEKYLAPNAIENVKISLISNYKGLPDFLTKDELKGIKDPLVELVSKHESTDKVKEFIEALENINK